MSVERRYMQRLPIDMPVNVHCRGQEDFSARARNISVEGMFLSGGPRMQAGIVIGLEVFTGSRDWMVDALVVHSGNPGTGVMFLESQHQLVLACASATIN